MAHEFGGFGVAFYSCSALYSFIYMIELDYVELRQFEVIIVTDECQENLE